MTWFEAEAYCRWLTGQLHDSGVIESGMFAHLPSELEWERAARGEDGRDYPWQGEFDRRLANTGLSELGASTAVCAYPGGVSPSGAWDMSGNVWEWTSSPWSVEDDDRVVRGGSWILNQRDARCAVRNGFIPANFYFDLGFRVVVSLANSGS